MIDPKSAWNKIPRIRYLPLSMFFKNWFLLIYKNKFTVCTLELILLMLHKKLNVMGRFIFADFGYVLGYGLIFKLGLLLII